ncbi:MAG TPA: beta-ketoacyl-ACP synthase [Gammaproteobacteria bacterium]|nr:beta-ketoacyl-ACP synthase [Gammaproteobacteria bacterium]
MKRVVITGGAGFSPIGSSWKEIKANLAAEKTGTQYMTEWDVYEGLTTRLGAPIKNFTMPPHYTRKHLRSMGRVAQLGTLATEQALENAGLLEELPRLSRGKIGVSYGSWMGSTDAIAVFGHMLNKHVTDGLNANSYLKMMSHTAAVNIGVHFGLQGRIITTSSACTSGSQGIGYAYEAIKSGAQDIMVAGGAEELCQTQAAVFDTLYATSTCNDTPECSPRPFDRDRDGLVIGEGACTIVLEELSFAQARGATILAEIVGYGTNSDGMHVTQPNSETMEVAMRLALEDAGVNSTDIGYVSAHGTATDRGDVAETQATRRALGRAIPISAFKSYTGHTLGACGALEAWISIHMMRECWFHGTANLRNLDADCGDLDYLTGSGRDITCDYVMSNNFAFGGINTSLIFKLWDQ